MSDSISGIGEDGGWEQNNTKKDTKEIRMGHSQSNVDFHSRSVNKSQKKNKFLTMKPKSTMHMQGVK